MFKKKNAKQLYEKNEKFEKLKETKERVRGIIMKNSSSRVEQFDDIIFLFKDMHGQPLAQMGGSYVYIDPVVIHDKELFEHVILHETSHYLTFESGGDPHDHSRQFFDIFTEISGNDFRGFYNERGELRTEKFTKEFGETI